MCSHNASPSFTRSFEWFCSSWFLQFLVTIVTPYILLIVWQNAVIPAQMYRCVGGRPVRVSKLHWLCATSRLAAPTADYAVLMQG